MLYELRRYRTTPAGAAGFEAAFREELLPLLREHGFELVGAWSVDVGAGGELVWMLRWPSMAAREEAFAAVRADPRNVRFRERHLAQLVSTTSELLRPTPFSPLP